MSSRTREQMEKWIKGIEVSGKVLDVGGSQLPIRDRVHKLPATEFTILDIANPHETKQFPDIIHDLNEDLTHKKVDSFDYAFCMEVSEYWWDPVTALKNINHYLKFNGTLFISFHFVYPVHNPPPYDFLRYTRAGALKLLNQTGFEVIEIEPRTASFAHLTQLYGYERMRMAKDYKYHEEVGLLVKARKI